MCKVPAQRMGQGSRARQEVKLHLKSNGNHGRILSSQGIWVFKDEGGQRELKVH